MRYSASQEPLFALLPRSRTPWTEFVFSTGGQAAAVAFLIWVRLLYPSIISAPEHTYRSVELVATPVPINLQPQRKPALVARLDVPSDALRLPAQPKAAARMKMEDVAAPTVSVAPK